MSARKHNKRGNCQQVYDKNNDYVDVCVRHEAMRGGCEECPRCPACDEDEIADLRATVERLQEERA